MVLVYKKQRVKGLGFVLMMFIGFMMVLVFYEEGVQGSGFLRSLCMV